MTTVERRLERLEGRPSPRWGGWPVTPSYDLDALTETDVRFILALQGRGGELTEEERAAVAVIDGKAGAR